MVPEALDRRLREVLDLDRSLEGKSYTAAARIIRFYLGDAWIEQRVSLRDPHDPFMLNEFDEESENRVTHRKRVADLGDAIFGLRNVEGFGAMVARLRQPVTRPRFFEAITAADLVDDGFVVRVTEEVGQRGLDFDFSASRGGQSLAVDVTAKDEGPLTAQTVLNTLQGKRTQFPVVRPGLLVVIIPDSWTLDANADAIQNLVFETTDRYFRGSARKRGTRRINAVKYVWSNTIRVPEKGRFIAEMSHVCVNPNPYHQIEDAIFLAPPTHLGDLRGLHQALAVDAESVVSAMDARSHMPRFWAYYEPAQNVAP